MKLKVCSLKRNIIRVYGDLGSQNCVAVLFASRHTGFNKESGEFKSEDRKTTIEDFLDFFWYLLVSDV